MIQFLRQPSVPLIVTSKDIWQTFTLSLSSCHLGTQTFTFNPYQGLFSRVCLEVQKWDWLCFGALLWLISCIGRVTLLTKLFILRDISINCCCSGCIQAAYTIPCNSLFASNWYSYVCWTFHPETLNYLCVTGPIYVRVVTCISLK